MRIGWITGEYPPMQGGVGAYTQILARHVRDLGHECFIFTDQRAASSDGRLHVTAAVRKWTPDAIMRAKRWAQEHQLDVISLQYQTAAYGMSPFIHFAPDLLRPFPVVTTFHDLRFPYLFPKAGALRPWIVRRLARASAAAIVTNDEDLAALAAHGIAAAVIPIGSNIDPTGSQPHPRSDSDFVIAFFGLVNASKGLDLLLESARALIDQGVPTKLWLIGAVVGSSDSTNLDYAKKIDVIIDRLALRPHLLQTEFLDDAGVAAYLRAADVVALPFRDGASLRRGSLMAALTCGTAIVTTAPAQPIPALDDAVLFCEPTADSLTAALHALYAEPERRIRLREAATRAAHQFDWGQIAERTIAVFERARESQPTKESMR
jgi:glycosyltransferase involved in cell wall biosynthesis